MSKSDSFLAKALTGVSWPIGSSKNTSTVKVDNPTFLVRYLHALSYTEHEVINSSRKIVKDDKVLKVSIKLEKLWGAVQSLMNQRKFNKAEGLLLSIIKIDKYNASAYNRLGILYARSQKYDESIECFKTATKLEPSASSHHNLALIYFETSNYKSSLKHFKIAIKYDDQFAARFIAIAKVHEKLGNNEYVIKNLEIARKMEPSRQISKLLFNAYKNYGYDEQAIKIEKQMLASLNQEVREVKQLEHKKISDESIFPPGMIAGYQY